MILIDLAHLIVHGSCLVHAVHTHQRVHQHGELLDVVRILYDQIGMLVIIHVVVDGARNDTDERRIAQLLVEKLRNRLHCR